MTRADLLAHLIRAGNPALTREVGRIAGLLDGHTTGARGGQAPADTLHHKPTSAIDAFRTGKPWEAGEAYKRAHAGKPSALEVWRGWFDKVGGNEIGCPECYTGRECFQDPPCEWGERWRASR